MREHPKCMFLICCICKCNFPRCVWPKASLCLPSPPSISLNCHGNPMNFHRSSVKRHGISTKREGAVRRTRVLCLVLVWSSGGGQSAWFAENRRIFHLILSQLLPNSNHALSEFAYLQLGPVPVRHGGRGTHFEEVGVAL